MEHLPDNWSNFYTARKVAAALRVGQEWQTIGVISHPGCVLDSVMHWYLLHDRMLRRKETGGVHNRPIRKSVYQIAVLEFLLQTASILYAQTPATAE